MSLRDLTLRGTIDTIGLTGTPVVFAEDGVLIPGGLHLIDTTSVDYRVRTSLTFKNRAPVYDKKTLNYTKEKKSVSVVVPFVLTTGQMVFNTLRIEMEVHPEAEQSENVKGLFKAYGVDILTTEDTDAFWAAGALS